MIQASSLKITHKLLFLIAKIDEFKGTWQALSVLEPERLLALKKTAIVESVGSSTRIEGSDLSDHEVELLLSNIKTKSLKTRSEQEVAGYAQTMDLIYESWENISIDENHIKQLHHYLLRYSKKDAKHRGKYKTLSNKVVALNQQGKQIGVIFNPAKPFDTPRLMKELIIWFKNTGGKSLHPLLQIAIFIVVFLQIHPFQDGNGRLSRLLTNLLLLRLGYNYTVYYSLEKIIEENKKSYYLALRKTQKTIYNKNPNWNPWILFFLQLLSQQIQRLMKKIEYEKTIVSHLPAISIKILQHTKRRGRATMSDMVRDIKISRNTIKEHFRKLVKKGYLVQHGRGRGVWYSYCIKP